MREQKEDKFVKAVRRNTQTPHKKAKRMFDSDGKLKQRDEIERGQDGHVTRKRPRI